MGLRGQTIKFANSSRYKCCIPHCWIPPWSPSKYSPWEAMHRCQRLVHSSKQFWNWFCGMAFRAAVVLLLMSSVSSKCLSFNISFIFGNRKKSGCSNTVICLVAKNSFTGSAVLAGALSWCKIHELLAKSSGRFRLSHAAFSVLPNSKLG